MDFRGCYIGVVHLVKGLTISKPAQSVVAKLDPNVGQPSKTNSVSTQGICHTSASANQSNLSFSRATCDRHQHNDLSGDVCAGTASPVWRTHRFSKSILRGQFAMSWSERVRPTCYARGASKEQADGQQ